MNAHLCSCAPFRPRIEGVGHRARGDTSRHLTSLHGHSCIQVASLIPKGTGDGSGRRYVAVRNRISFLRARARNPENA